MTDYFNKSELFMEPKIQQYGNHMVMTNVHKSTKIKHISIDTKFRDDYDYTQPADFQVVLPERVNNIHSLSVTNMEIPMTFYNIAENLGNTYFKITNGANTEIIKIDDNNYDATSLQTEIQAKLNTSTHGSGLTITINNMGKTSISTTSNITVNFNVDKNGNSDKFNFKYKIGWLLGFRKTTYNIVNATATKSECILDLTGPHYLYLAIDEFNQGNQNSFVSPLSSSLINKNIIARISLDKSQYSYGSILPANAYNGLLATDKRCYTGKVDLQKLQIQLLNETGTPMNLNGYDFSFCLEANCE
tara:strand:+ start:35 stop:943 length:909 start_codon:yes stop_codon:yes gene_type:complete